MRLVSSLASLSAYKRADAHLTRQTAHGAIVTILGILLGITLASHETYWYFSGRETSRMMVDTARRHDLQIHIDISFPAIPCAGLSVDVMDASGSTGNDVTKVKDVQLHKVRLDGRGRRVGGKDGEYVTPQSQKIVHDKAGTVMQIDLGAAMTQMSDMDAELAKHEGCRVHGEVAVRRVAGKLHFAVHQQSFVDVLPQMLTGHILPKLTNMSHVIHRVGFGPEYPGQVNPLDGFSRIVAPGEPAKAFKYYLKIVPTDYLTRMGVVLETNQYSVGEFAMPLQTPGPAPAATPGAPSQPTSSIRDAFLDLSYDLSPIIMTINQSPASLLHFLVRLCAVVGGVLSVTRMTDKLVHAALVAAGLAPQPASSKARNSSSSGYGGSARSSSFGGDGAAYVRPSGGYSYPGQAPGTPGGSGPTLSSGGSGLLQHEGSLHQRLHGSYPGSHPLSRMTSNGSSVAAGLMPVAHSLGGISTGGGAAPPLFTASSLPGGFGSTGGAATSAGGAAPMMRQQGSGALMGDALVASGGGGINASHGGGAGGAPAGLGAPLLGGFSSAPVVRHGSSGGVLSPGSTPTAQQAALMNSVGSSRLSTASGPGSGGGAAQLGGSKAYM